MKSTKYSKQDAGVRTTRQLSLRSNFAWTLVGTGIYTGCQWAMLMVFAKLGTPVIVGQFALALALTAPVILLANLNLRMVQATDARYRFHFGDYLGLRLFALACAVLVIAGINLVFRYSFQITLVIWMVTLAKIFDSLSDVIYGLLQQHERMDRIAISRIIQGMLQLTALALVFHLTGSLFLGTLSMAIVSGLVTAGYDVTSAVLILGLSSECAEEPWQLGRAMAQLRPRWAVVPLRQLAWIAMPLGIVAGLQNFNVNVPRYFVEHYLGAGALGVFAAMAYVVWAMGMVQGSLVHSALPRLARYYLEDIRGFKRLLGQLTLLSTANGLVGILVVIGCGKFVLTLLYTPEYARYPATFLWLMIGAGFSHIVWAVNGGITAARQFTAQVPAYVAAIVATALGCIWWIPDHHLLGAAWGMCAGWVVLLLIFCGILRSAIQAQQRQETPGRESLFPRSEPLVEED